MGRADRQAVFGADRADLRLGNNAAVDAAYLNGFVADLADPPAGVSERAAVAAKLAQGVELQGDLGALHGRPRV